MKGVVKFEKGHGNIGVTEVEDPHMDEGDVLIQIVAAGICHSDLLVIEWSPSIEEEYHPSLPLVMGHEFSGRVIGTGKRVEGFEVGDPVVVNPILYCGRCL